MDTFWARAAVLATLIVVAAAAGLWRRRVDGRARAVTGGTQVTADELGQALGRLATLLQFSAPVCAPCRAARRVLAEVAATVPDVAHVEVDAAEHLALVRRLAVLRTPTVLVLDADGQVVARASGVPTRAQVVQALDLAGAGAEVAA
jgi:thiol-disulfide isomerase/thioredoxin